MNNPFPHIVIDEWIPLELCRAAVAEWPDERWPHWFPYRGERGTKYVTKDASRLTPACEMITREMARIPIAKVLGIHGTFPDLMLWGSGMSMIPAGGELPKHLDPDHHPLTNWQRAVSAVVYVCDCGGGELQLWNSAGTAVEKTIEPKPGRLVLFECGDTSWHAVAPVHSGVRLSLSMFFWRMAAHKSKRPRAEFASR